METSKIEEGLPVIVDHMGRVGYSEGYIASVERLARWIIENAHEWSGWDDAKAAVSEKWGEGSVGSGVRCHLTLIRQFIDYGALPRTEASRRYERRGARAKLGHGFAQVCDSYEASPEAASKKPSTVRNELSNAASFLAKLESMGVTSVDDVTEENILEILTGPDGGPAFSTSHVKQVKAVLSCAHDVDGCMRLASLLPVPKRWRKIVDAMTEDERGNVGKALADPGSALSQRDRAIGCVLLYTGMRPCAVAALRLDSIDWERDVIELDQGKTGERLRIPLVAQVGNAIFDYVTGERGPSSCPYVFLSLEWPFGRLGSSSIGDVAGRVLDAAGVRREEGDRRGARLFRRTVASAMMSAGVDRSVIAATLGHASPASAESYMSADVEGLRRRALDVSRFPIAEGALL
ncbi:MAG: tyrosine-type recombinase/integrase [Atopobiaceae bacterium]|nr:tyrosine-type recombinase/integrase [Atopobiaceae bacterium]